MSGIKYAEGDDPYADSPDAGDESACNCHGAWHARMQHCVDWPCPGCDPYRICSTEPGAHDVHNDEDDEDDPEPGADLPEYDEVTR
ncbi:hypothetical protein ACFXPN_29590 [Streptomyces griseorubiginosus]|uniref:hypothetical protein n=1 Tax=Streptomyces griseorubiginosus TaxID=67304 RepID=UPI0036811C60